MSLALDILDKGIKDYGDARVAEATAPLKAENTALKSTITARNATIAALEARVAELEAENERLRNGTPPAEPTDPTPPPDEEPEEPVGVGTIYWDKTRLKRLPRSGTTYDKALARARGTWQEPIFWGESPSNNAQGDADVQVGAVMAVTLDDAALYEKCRKHLRLAATKPSNWLLGKARQLPGYIEAAWLIGFHEPEFVSWVHSSFTQKYGDGQRWGSLDTILRTGFEFNSNWGFMSLRAIIVGSVYLKRHGSGAQQSDATRWLTLAVLQYKRLVGEPGDYSALPPLITADNGWGGSTGKGYGINPEHSTFVSGSDGITRDGSGIIQGDWLRAPSKDGGEDRAAKYYPPQRVTYHWEGLTALTVTAAILDNLGLVPFRSGNDAIARAFKALHGQSRNTPPAYIPAERDDLVGAHIVYEFTGIDFERKPNLEPDKAGYGWGDWYWGPLAVSAEKAA